MKELIINPNKKYPILPKQILTEREGCIFCHGASLSNIDNESRGSRISKCCSCGFGTIELINGLLIGMFERMRVPMVLVEKVNCPTVISTLPENGYFKEDGTIYHLINVFSVISKGFADSIVYQYRVNNKQIDGMINKKDTEKAHEVFKAIDHDLKNFFQEYNEDGKVIFDYHSYKCQISGLTEVIIPIYFNPKICNRSSRGVVGLLFLGQILIGEIPSNQEEWDNDIWDVIQNLRDDIWKGNNNEKQSSRCNYGQPFTLTREDNKKEYDSIESALFDHKDNIVKFLNLMGNEMHIRTMDFLHGYQSTLVNQFLISGADFSRKINGDELKTKIIKIFTRIWEDFDLKRIRIFFPDLELKEMKYKNRIIGQKLYVDEQKQNRTEDIIQIEINIEELNKTSTFNEDIDDLLDSGCLIINSLDERFKMSDFFEKPKIDTQKSELYVVAYGDSTEKSIFGVFIEWNTLPSPKQEYNHKNLFKAVVSVCAAEIMALIATKRASRLSSFAEEVRHDLAHRLQTLDSHNKSFQHDMEGYFESKEPISKMDFQWHTKNYLDANRELFETLEFTKEELDSTNIFRKPDIDKVFLYKEIFLPLRHLFTAPWHPRNFGHELIVDRTQLYREPVHIYADRVMVRRAITNLIDNAFKYSPPRTNIYITYKRDSKSDEEVIEITNFSYGIEESLSKRMFEYGQKGEGAAAGKGIGLYIVKDFVERNYGTVHLVSGMIPKTNGMNEKIENGLIAQKNITVINKIHEWKRNHPQRRAEIEPLEVEIEAIISNLKKDVIADLSSKVGKANTLATVMVNPNKSFLGTNRSEDPLTTLGDLIEAADRSLYKTTFQLRFKNGKYIRA